MGSALEICNQADVKSNLIQPEIENDKKYYQPNDINNIDEQFNLQLNTLKQQQNFQQFLINKHFFKHTQKDDYYLGQWIDNCKHGKGISYRKGQYFYYGHFNKVPHGNGYLKLYKQNIVIQGQMVEGKLTGECKVRDLNGKFNFQGIISKDSKLPKSGIFQVINFQHTQKSYKIHLENYPEIPAKIQFNDGTQYVGQISFETLLPSGQGQATYLNKSTYTGQWQNGQYHGQGHFRWADGSNYSGSYINGIKSGHGLYQYVSKKVYEGEWVNGKQEGQGILYSSDKNVLKNGRWENGVFKYPVSSKIQQVHESD